MNVNPIGWLCVTIAMGCLFVSGVTLAVYLIPESDPPPWSRTVAARSFMAAIALVGVSIPTWRTPDDAARFDFWLLHSQQPITGPALWFSILTLVSIGITVGASIAAIFSESDWIWRFQKTASYARTAGLWLFILSIVFGILEHK